MAVIERLSTITAKGQTTTPKAVRRAPWASIMAGRPPSASMSAGSRCIGPMSSMKIPFSTTSWHSRPGDLPATPRAGT